MLLDMRFPILARTGGRVDEILMRARHYSLEELALAPDVAGVVKWGVALRNTMLTYFEVRPNAIFKEHQHPNEQITLVLEGELFFEVDGRTIAVRAGEVVAIPGDLPHAAYTLESWVRAVDAWSPPVEEHVTTSRGGTGELGGRPL